MAIQPLTPVILLAAIVGSGVAVFVWVFRDTVGAKPLAGFVVAASVFALAQGMSLATPTLVGKTFWSNVTATASPVLPLAWFGMVRAYVDGDRGPTGTVLALLLLEPLVFVALVWTNGEHALVWADRWIETAGGTDFLAQEYGLGMWAHVGYSYLLLAAGALALVRMSFQSSDFFRTQGTALLAAMFVPMLLGAASVYGAVPEHYDLSGVGFVFAGVVMTATLFRGQLLSVTPATRRLGREAVIDEMDDRIVILDDEDRIVDVNPAAARLLDVEPDSVVGSPLDAVASKLAAAIESVESGQSELELDGADGRHYYDVRVSRLYRSYGTTAGRVVSFRDVTDRRQHEQRLDVLNRVLRHNLRNELNVISGNAELLRRDVDDSDERVRERLDRIETTADTVTQRSEKIGQISRAIDGACSERFDAATHLEALADAVESTYPAASVTVDVPPDLTVVGGPALERAFEELLENAAEHAGEAPCVDVVGSRCTGPYAEIRITDDGPGIERQERVVIEEGRETALRHGSGVGLWLVNWVVREFGGSVQFAGSEDGTEVVVALPDADAGDSDRLHVDEPADANAETSDTSDTGASGHEGNEASSSATTGDGDRGAREAEDDRTDFDGQTQSETATDEGSGARADD